MSDAKEVAQVMSRFVNGGGSHQTAEFIEEMGRDHRTLQQSFTKVCFAWIKHLAEVERYDARNEASILACRKILAGEIKDKYDLSLPLI